VKPEKPGPIFQPLYATTIQEILHAGDVHRMKEVAKEAEQYLQQTGDLSAALQALKIEIAKAERK
jgi:Domain of unknown function (DUF1843)